MRRSPILATLAAAAVLVPAATAALSAVTVNLNVQGGIGNRTLRACGLTHHYTLVHRGRAIKVDGSVGPAPSGSFRIKLKIKRCVNGHFRTVWTGAAVAGTGGAFNGTLPPRKAGFYFVRAYLEGSTIVKSDKQYVRAQ